MAGLSDTSPDVERMLIEVHRRMSPARKWLLLDRIYRAGRALHAAGMRLRDPAITARQITAAWIRTNLGCEFPPCSPVNERGDPMPSLQDFAEVARVFDQLGIVYALGGSMASSIHGVLRNTNDADVTVEPFSGKEAALVAALGSDYYVSESAIQQALRAKSSFNIINTLTGFKVDVFLRGDEPFQISAMSRRITFHTEGEPSYKVVVHSAEDVILYKLRWYRLGNEVSEQQWKDITNVMKTQGPRIDRDYLDQWAMGLKVDDLLVRAWSEVNAAMASE